MSASTPHGSGGFDQEAAGRIYKLRLYLHDLHKTGLPLDFSLTGLQNLGSRFGVPVEAVKHQIDYVLAETARLNELTEAQAASWLAGSLDCDTLCGREGLERRLRLVGCDRPGRVIDFCLAQGWLKDYGTDGLELAFDCVSWLPTGVTPAARPSVLDSPFSVFDAPIVFRGTPPQPTSTTLRKLHQKIVGSKKLQDLTERLRRETDPKRQAQFKKYLLPYATFSGTFDGRTDASLIRHSELIAVDVDHLGADLQAVRASVIADPHVLMAFISPRGDGLKVIFQTDPAKHTQAEWYLGLSRYLVQTHGCPPHTLDPSGSNVSRACFLSFDPECHLNTAL
jgi:hypothetical protein